MNIYLWIFLGCTGAYILANVGRFPPYKAWRKRRDEHLILRAGHGPLLTARNPAVRDFPRDGAPLREDEQQYWVILTSLHDDTEAPDADYPATTHETPHAEDETK